MKRRQGKSRTIFESAQLSMVIVNEGFICKQWKISAHHWGDYIHFITNTTIRICYAWHNIFILKYINATQKEKKLALVVASKQNITRAF